MAVNQEEVMQMQGTLAGIQDQLVVINQRMAGFIDNSMMDELSNKIEKERTDAADTRSRLSDEVIKMKEEITDIQKDAEEITKIKKNTEDNKNKISTMGNTINLMKDEIKMFRRQSSPAFRTT